VSEVETFGPVGQIECQRWRRGERAASKFRCLVRHQNETFAEWCIVLEPDRVLTNHEVRDGSGPGCL
jgi:hypothetical protein